MIFDVGGDNLFERFVDWIFEDGDRVETMWIVAVTVATWAMTIGVLSAVAGVVWLM